MIISNETQYYLINGDLKKISADKKLSFFASQLHPIVGSFTQRKRCFFTNWTQGTRTNTPTGLVALGPVSGDVALPAVHWQ